MSGPINRRGFTLVEILCSLAVLIALVGMVGSFLVVGYKQRQHVGAYADQNRQLRLAMQQFTQDLSGTRYEDASPRNKNPLTQLEVVGYQPYASRDPNALEGSTFDWTDPALKDWPGDLVLLAKVYIRYTIGNGILRREVHSVYDGVSSSQELVTGLAPGSQMILSPDKTEVTLVLRKEPEGGGRDAEVRTTIYLSY